MHASLIETWHPDVMQQLQTLLACDEVRIINKKGGGNSAVYCIAAQDKQWALKVYPPYAPAERDRLAAELQVYQFLNAHQLNAVPALKTYCEDQRWLVIEWVDGEIPAAYTKHDIEQAIQFINEVAQLNHSPMAQALPEAAEACLSLTLLIQQIERRFQRLYQLSDEPALSAFLKERFLPAFNTYQQQAYAGYAAYHIDPQQPLASAARSLIPADFGFHNSLKNAAGKLYFFDFDYFGWDDPVKLLADILWHPKMTLSAAAEQQFITGIAAIYAADPLFMPRFELTKALFGLRWALILLNEFIPAFWQNRQHAGAFTGSQAEAQALQLDRANALLLSLSY